MDMERFTQRWTRYKRATAKQETSSSSRPLSCRFCSAQLQPDLETFKTHVRADADKHQPLGDDAAIEEAFKEMTLENTSKGSPPPRPSDKKSRKRSGPGNKDFQEDDPAGTTAAGSAPPLQGVDPADPDQRGIKKIRSPTASVAQQRGSSPSPSSSAPNRSRARQPDSVSDFDRGHGNNPSGRRLWSQDEPKTPQSRSRLRPPPAKLSRPGSSAAQSQPQSQAPLDSQPQTSEDPPVASMIRQPETRPIAQEQLVAEVKGIYAGLVMVESKCIEVDSTQASNTDSEHQLSNEQWQALIALHRTLLHEHHDFFLASQHPSASAALRRLASKYAMPARMWRHAIHSFLELLRHKLPASLEHMLTFIYLAYSMVALLYETVPTFKETWIECLGDLGRYRMAIEDDDIRDREIWTSVSQHWYSMASDKAPTTGRLYHHLAILARPNALQQLYYYAKSLCVPMPFSSARESIMTLFDPLLSSKTTRLAPVDAAFVRVNGVLFSDKAQDQLEPAMKEVLSLLDGHIGRTTKRWLESGYYIGISIGCSLLGYGDDANVLMQAISRPEETDIAMDGSLISEASPGETFKTALQFAASIWDIVLRRWGDTNTLPFVHVTLVFLHYMSHFPAAMVHIERQYPWKLTAVMLNSLLQSSKSLEMRIDSEKFPGPEKNQSPRPLPEDRALNGLLYAQEYLPYGFLAEDKTDDDEKTIEFPSMMDDRRERILWLGRRIATSSKWLIWADEDREFSVVSEYEKELEGIPTTGLEAPEQTLLEGPLEGQQEILVDAP